MGGDGSVVCTGEFGYIHTAVALVKTIPGACVRETACSPTSFNAIFNGMRNKRLNF